MDLKKNFHPIRYRILIFFDIIKNIYFQYIKNMQKKQGTYKVRNEIETKRNGTKRNEINEKETKRNEINKNETKRNEINETKRNQRNENELKRNQHEINKNKTKQTDTKKMEG